MQLKTFFQNLSSLKKIWKTLFFGLILKYSVIKQTKLLLIHNNFYTRQVY